MAGNCIPRRSLDDNRMLVFADGTPLHEDLDDASFRDEAAKRRQWQAHEFAKNIMRPCAARLDRLPADEVPRSADFWSFFRSAHGDKYHTLAFDKTIGGEGASLYEQSLVYEELGWGSSGLSLSLLVSQIPFLSLAHYAQPELSAKYLGAYLADRQAEYIGCYPVTEPAHGSDLFFISNPVKGGDPNERLSRLKYETNAYLDGSTDQWVINGQKAQWITNTSVATHAFVLATLPTGESGGFLVPLESEGVHRGAALEKIGQREMNQAGITFKDVRVPRHCMLVSPENYRTFIANTFGDAHILIGAVCVGIARAAFEEAVAYCKNRVQGGVPLVEHQDVQRRLMDIFAEIELMRAYVRSLARYHSAGRRDRLMHYTAIVRGHVSQQSFKVCSEALELFGHVGFSKGVLIEKLYRDARMTTMMGGSGTVARLRGAMEFLS